jgi:hypothetical protein
MKYCAIGRRTHVQEEGSGSNLLDSEGSFSLHGTNLLVGLLGRGDCHEVIVSYLTTCISDADGQGPGIRSQDARKVCNALRRRNGDQHRSRDLRDPRGTRGAPGKTYILQTYWAVKLERMIDLKMGERIKDCFGQVTKTSAGDVGWCTLVVGMCWTSLLEKGWRYFFPKRCPVSSSQVRKGVVRITYNVRKSTCGASVFRE